MFRQLVLSLSHRPTPKQVRGHCQCSRFHILTLADNAVVVLYLPPLVQVFVAALALWRRSRRGDVGMERGRWRRSSSTFGLPFIIVRC